MVMWQPFGSPNSILKRLPLDSACPHSDGSSGSRRALKPSLFSIATPSSGSAAGELLALAEPVNGQEKFPIAMPGETSDLPEQGDICETCSDQRLAEETRIEGVDQRCRSFCKAEKDQSSPSGASLTGRQHAEPTFQPAGCCMRRERARLVNSEGLGPAWVGDLAASWGWPKEIDRLRPQAAHRKRQPVHRPRLIVQSTDRQEYGGGAAQISIITFPWFFRGARR
jgi:hypothetical protein